MLSDVNKLIKLRLKYYILFFYIFYDFKFSFKLVFHKQKVWFKVAYMKFIADLVLNVYQKIKNNR